ncbi:MAG: 3-methyl-2-oxobutanoate dehydrogenase subunit VorB [Lentisphaerae bacterium]|nr:3-methyl-2-oxobutanoate dehydrogenase subunit VorB [Lentisphaerota bacterium]MCP4100273.1 3-methyl-2-oxobutanoate dehydrogenase subunit VorB [Lentisphaerota bacterium]
MEYTRKILLKGNEAAVYGALLAGCDCYFGYPITPASEIAHTAAKFFPKLGRVFLQAESEIAAINMVMGASAAGRRVMTASSGLGISLKQEGVSYLAGSELPAVIIDITRGGPGLGNIGPEQSDYNQVVKGGGHGSYRCIVLAPSSVQEMCDLTAESFDLAEKYRTPVYVMADGVIGQMMESLKLPEPAQKKYDVPDWALDSVNGRNNMITSIFLEHDELEAVNIKLQKKYAEIRATEQRAEEYCMEDAEIVFVGYGIAGRIARSAVDRLREEGVKAGLIRPITLFPFPVESIMKSLDNAKIYFSVEMSCGQLIDDVKLAIECARPVKLINRMGGNIPTVDEIIDKCRKEVAELDKKAE